MRFGQNQRAEQTVSTHSIKMSIVATLISDPSIVLIGFQKPWSFSLEMPCGAHGVMGCQSVKLAPPQEDQIWHPFLWSMFCGWVLRKRGHECVSGVFGGFFSACTGTAVSRLYCKTGGRNNWLSLCCKKQTQFPVEVRLFSRLGFILSTLCWLWSQDPHWLGYSSAAVLSQGLKNSFSALLSLSTQSRQTAGSPTRAQDMLTDQPLNDRHGQIKSWMGAPTHKNEKQTGPGWAQATHAALLLSLIHPESGLFVTRLHWHKLKAALTPRWG